jgi:hypothetical protein
MFLHFYRFKLVALERTPQRRACSGPMMALWLAELGPDQLGLSLSLR